MPLTRSPDKSKRSFRRIGHAPAFQAFCMNFIYLILVLLFCDLKYEVSDDFEMAAILSGAYGETQNPHLIFVNILLGYLLKPFYQLIPQISWYFVFQIIIIYLSSTAVSFMLLRRLTAFKAITLSYLILVFFTSDAYILVQFTKTAMFATMAGSLLFIDELFKEQKKSILLLSSGLCIFGTLIRFSDIYICGGFLILILLYEFIKIVKEKNYKRMIRIILMGGVLICIAFCLFYVNEILYEQDSEYSYFREYGKARSSIVDYADYGYSDAFSNIGISENDYCMMKTWSFGDEDIFNLETMQKTAEIIEKQYHDRQISISVILNTIRTRGVLQYPILWCCISGILFGIFIFPEKWRWFFSTIAIGGGYFFYFAFRERLIYRIEFSVLLGLFLCIIYFIQDSKSVNILHKIQKIFSVTIMIGCLCWNIFLFIPDTSYQIVTSDTRQKYINDVFWESWNYNSKKYRTIVNKKKPENNLLSEIEQNQDKFYFMDFDTTVQTLYFEYSPWKTLPMNYFNNHLRLGGVTTNFPDVVRILERNNIDELLKSLVDENVYLIDNFYPEMKLKFLQEHYYPKARIELYKEIDGYQIWKLYKK